MTSENKVIAELLKVPNVGPETAQAAHRTLGVDSIDDLEQAARNGDLQDLDGIGPITEGKIHQGIRLYKAGATGRMPLDVAKPVAENARDRLTTHSAVDRIDITGSIRRRKDRVGDIDLIVQADDAGPVFDAVTDWEAVDEVLARGDTKLSVRADRFQIDVRVVPEESYGAALQYFTGSQEHNVALRSRAKKRGLKLSEYGLFDRETDNWLAGRTEHEIYEYLDLAYPEPSAREGYELDEWELQEAE